MTRLRPECPATDPRAGVERVVSVKTTVNRAIAAIGAGRGAAGREVVVTRGNTVVGGNDVVTARVEVVTSGRDDVGADEHAVKKKRPATAAHDRR